MPVTGRRPVAVMSDDLREFGWPDPPADEITTFSRTVADLDPWPLLQRWVNDLPVERHHLRRYLAAFPADLVERAMTELPEVTTEPQWDRWLFTQLQRDPALHALVPVDYLIGTRRWHDPGPYSIVLLPTDRTDLIPLYADFHGAGGPALGAALRQWQQHWGAELVASWGTMLQFLVSNPPQELEAAYQLAGQIKSVAGSEQSMQHQLALALTRSDAWFLHDRP